MTVIKANDSSSTWSGYIQERGSVSNNSRVKKYKFLQIQCLQIQCKWKESKTTKQTETPDQNSIDYELTICLRKIIHKTNIILQSK